MSTRHPRAVRRRAARRNEFCVHRLTEPNYYLLRILNVGFNWRFHGD